jgi:uncharacterized protein DUF4136
MARLIPRAPRAPRMAHLISALPIVVAFAVSGCSSSAMQVNTDFDRTANFSALKTYSWREGTPIPNPLMSERVVSAVDAQLAAKGLQKVDSAGDMTVTYHAATDQSMEMQTFSTGGYYGCWGGCMGTTSTTVNKVTTGTLIVDLVDTKSNKMLWRGTGSDTVTGDPQDTERKINEVVKRMFGNFPPKP